MAEKIDDGSEVNIPLRERPLPEIAEILQGVLGQRLTAYGIGEKDPGRIGAFARGEDNPSEQADATLRDLAEVTETLQQTANDETIRALMIGMNPILGDEAAIQLFHEGEGARVVAAAPHLDL